MENAERDRERGGEGRKEGRGVGERDPDIRVKDSWP